jgi:hypothetical protein
MSLSAPNTITGVKAALALTFGYPAKASKVFWAGGIVARDATTKYAVPCTGAAGQIVLGVSDLDQHPSLDTTGQNDGDSVIVVKSGIMPFAIGSGGDALAKADEGNDVYAIDDCTIGKTDGGTGRPVAGQLVMLADVQGNPSSSGTIAWVAIGPAFRAPNVGPNVGKGSTETVTGAGALSVNTEISLLQMPNGATALTLANGLYKGQRKIAVVTQITGTPNATITPATKTGFSTVSALGALGDVVEFEWVDSTTGWIIVGNAGVTVA